MSLVRLPQGSYRGVEHHGISIWRGIPYAAPFVRFQAPVPPSPSDKEYDATSFGANCPQKSSRLQIVNGPTPPHSGKHDEKHCGVLSVYAPKTAKLGDKLPVIVFAHGGDFVTGGSQSPWYEGTRFARDRDVVVVSISYRLGAFGFFQNESDDLACGTLDAIRALEWVRDNIGFFGGDAENVTAYGQSASACQISSIVEIRPDLVRRAIVHSRPAGID